MTYYVGFNRSVTRDLDNLYSLDRILDNLEAFEHKTDVQKQLESFLMRFPKFHPTTTRQLHLFFRKQSLKSIKLNYLLLKDT